VGISKAAVEAKAAAEANDGLITDGIRLHTELFSSSALHQHPTMVLQENQCEPKTNEDDTTGEVWWDIPAMRQILLPPHAESQGGGTSPTALGSSLRVASQQTSSCVTESDVLGKNLAMQDEQDHLREQASGTSGKRDRISRILRYIENGAGNNSHLQHKRHVIVLGLTGSGKSTTINSLAGCKLRRVTEEEADRFELPRDALVVASGGERGGRKEVTKIGNRFGKSQTEVLQAVAVDENDDDAVATFFFILIIMKRHFSKLL